MTVAQETTETPAKAEDKGTELFAKQAARTNDLLAELLAQRAAPAAAEAPKQPEAQVYTREQLQAGLDSGQITTIDVADYLAQLRTTAAVKALREEFRVEIATADKSKSVASKLAAYRESYPELNERGSELRQKVVDRLAELAEEGHDPKDIRTELLACREAIGALDAPVKERTSSRQTSVESSGSRSSSGGDSSGGDKWPKWVPKQNRDFFDHQLEKGRYTGMTDERLKKDLGYLKKQLEDPNRRARRQPAA